MRNQKHNKGAFILSRETCQLAVKCIQHLTLYNILLLKGVFKPWISQITSRRARKNPESWRQKLSWNKPDMSGSFLKLLFDTCWNKCSYSPRQWGNLHVECLHCSSQCSVCSQRLKFALKLLTKTSWIINRNNKFWEFSKYLKRAEIPPQACKLNWKEKFEIIRSG